MKEGDKNTRFFKITLRRRHFNKIKKVRKSDGTITNDDQEIKNEAKCLYQKLLQPDQKLNKKAMNDILECIPKLIDHKKKRSIGKAGK